MNPTAFALLIIPALVLSLAQAEPLRFDNPNPWASMEIHAAEPMLARGDDPMPPTAPPPLPTPPSVGSGTEDTSDDGADADSRDDESILEQEREKKARESGSGTDGVDGPMGGSGTDSESVPDEVQPGSDD